MLNGICRAWNSDVISFERQEKLFPRQSLKMGLVIGTFAAVPYIHLQLEARKRFYPDIPCLIHDDASDKAAKLTNLCEKYGCHFESNKVRQAPCVGDLTAFVGGLLWAKQFNLDILLKLSRRWIFLADWTKSLSELAFESQYSTFCNYTKSFNFGFRTECVGMAVQKWATDTFLGQVVGRIKAEESVFVEGYLHNIARDFERDNCAVAEAWREAHPAEPDKNGYAHWSFMGDDRRERSENFLWHDSATSDDYFILSRAWELPYSLADFRDPNQGSGDRRAS